MLDDDTDGLLQPDQLRTMVAAVGIPPTQQLVNGITQCTPEKWRERGVDIDTVRSNGRRATRSVASKLSTNPHLAQFLSCCEVYLTKEPLSTEAIEEVFEYFEEDDVQHVLGKHLRHVLQGAFTSHNTQLLSSEVRRAHKPIRTTSP
jgi:Ca2+-binding EF-hand superfamily protein